MTDETAPDPFPRRLRRQLEGSARRAARRLRDHPRLGRLVRPTVSVILPIYNVEDYLAACLDSIADQDFTHYELLVVDDGSPDGSRAIAERYAARDHRIRIITRENGGLGAARNTGIRHARGRFLTFVDSDDKLPGHALAALVGSARDSGSDIVVGSVRRFDGERDWRPDWVNRVHQERRTGIRVVDFHPLLRNLYTWDKLFRRDFWKAQELWFREGVSYEDQPIITQLYLRARTIDVIPEVVYAYREREDQSSISQQTSSLADLTDRMTAFELTREVLRREASEEIYLAWLQTLFDSHLHWYLMSSGIDDDTFWDTIRGAVADFTEGAPQLLWDRTPPVRRVLLELARQDRRADLKELVWHEAEQVEDSPTTPTDEGVLLHLPFLGDPDLDDRLFLLRPEQLKQSHAIEKVRWVHGPDGDVSCYLSGWAYVHKIDLGEHDSQVRVVLRSSQGGREHVVESTGRPHAAYISPTEHTWCDYTPGTFEVELPVRRLLADSAADEVWTVLLEIRTCGFTVTAPVTRLLRSGSPGSLTSALLPDGDRIVPQWRLYEPLTLRRLARDVEVADLALDGRVLTGRVSGPGAHGVQRVTAVAGSRTSAAPVREGAFRLELPAAPETRRTSWRILGRRLDDSPVGLVLPASREVVTAAGGHTLVVQSDARAELSVTEWRLGVQALGAEVRPEGTLRITGRVYGADVREIALATRNKSNRVVGAAVHPVDGRFVVDLPLEHHAYRFGRRPLPVGGHDLSALVTVEGSEEPVEVPLGLAHELSDELPIVVDTEQLEGWVIRGPKGGVQVQLVRPLGAARGRYAQKRLELAAAKSTGLTRGVMFRSYFGELATDNGVSIQKALRERGSDLPVYWAVQSHSVVVPEGGIPVIVGSPQWHQLLSSVAYYVDNMYQPVKQVKRDGQVIVETFHGYPFKQMGHPHWRNLGFPQTKIDSYDQRAAQWDYLLSPARYATDLLRRDFAYDGEVLEIGYPRNDVLQSAEAPAIRAETRCSLGIADHQTAVLYAPTFRDYLSADDMRAEMVDFFDFAEAHRQLGDDVVFLVRGHAFNARSAHRVGQLDGCVDVTDYPEISDLYLAADAGVVDYSSLRFDFGVTGKPMIFHVPDLHRYQDTRGWLFDFEPTAPGPLVDTTAEVVDRLRDLDGVRDEYAAAYQTFRDDYLDLEDGQAGRRFVDAVFVPRGDA